MFHTKKDIKDHNLYKDLDWNNIRNLPAPFTPSPNDCLDTSYFIGKYYYYYFTLSLLY